jgi:hypothetical protein
MTRPPRREYFQNPAGRLLEQPADSCLVIEYTPGPRYFADLQTLLGHAKQLLALRGWNKVIGDYRNMTPFTPEEVDWVTNCWLSMPRTRTIHGAVLLPADVFARLDAATAAGLTYRRFADEAAAAAWLAQLP